MFRPVRLARSVSVASPPASAMVSSKYKARSTDWMLWPSPSRVRDARDLTPGPGRIVAFIGRFSPCREGKILGRRESRLFQHKERIFHNVKIDKRLFLQAN